MAPPAAARGLGTIVDEEAIITRRYLTQTVASQANVDPPFKKLAKKYMQFSQALQGGSAEEAMRLHQELLADLYTIQFHMQKLRAASDAFRREQQAYASKQAQLQASIQQAETDIESRKRELEQARVELQYQKEYEAIKQEIMQVPARSATRAEIRAVEEEAADLKQQGESLDETMVLRQQQFAGIAAAIEAVWEQLEQDGEEEGALPAEEGGGGGQQAGQQQPGAAGNGGSAQPMQLG